jgi:hypothetical protein
MVRKPSKEVRLSNEINELLKAYKDDHKYVKWVKNMVEVLKENMFAGEQIPKSQIPKQYKQRFGINNLYHYNHPEAFRSCYTIVEGCTLILDLMSHDEYTKLFGYAKA